MYVLAYVGAAAAEIAGCFSFWAWLRLGKSAWWIVPGMAALAAFAYLLTLVEVPAAGRAYAAYGGVLHRGVAGLAVGGGRGAADRWDALGAVLCLVGAAVILLGPRPITA